MKITLLTATALVSAMFTTAANASKDNQQIFPPSQEPVPLLKTINKTGGKRDELIKKEDIKTAIKTAKEDLDSLFAYETFSNPACPLSEEIVKLARDNKHTIAAMVIAKRLPLKMITKDDIQTSKILSEGNFYLGLRQNKNINRDVSIINTYLVVRPADVIRAQDFPDTIFAYKVASNRTNPELDLRFSLQHPNSAYAIGALRRKDIKISANLISWALKKENANTEVAYEIGGKLSAEQLTNEIKDKVRDELRNTKFAKSVAANKYFGYKHPCGIMLDDSGTPTFYDPGIWDISLDNNRQDILHIFYKQDLFSEGLAANTTLIITDQMKYAAWNSEKFYRSNAAYYLAKSSEWMKGIHTYESERFIMKNYETPLAYGHVENPDYYAQISMREFAKELAIKDQRTEFLLRLTGNPNYLKDLTQEQLNKEFEFAIKNYGSYSQGIFKNLPYSFEGMLVKFLLANPYRDDLGRGLLARKGKGFTPEDYPEFLDFVTGKSKEENLNTPLAQIFVQSDLCVPDEQMLSKVGDNRFLFFERALRLNPHINSLTARFDRKYIDN